MRGPRVCHVAVLGDVKLNERRYTFEMGKFLVSNATSGDIYLSDRREQAGSPAIGMISRKPRLNLQPCCFELLPLTEPV